MVIAIIPLQISVLRYHCWPVSRFYGSIPCHFTRYNRWKAFEGDSSAYGWDGRSSFRRRVECLRWSSMRSEWKQVIARIVVWLRMLEERIFRLYNNRIHFRTDLWTVNSQQTLTQRVHQPYSFNNERCHRHPGVYDLRNYRGVHAPPMSCYRWFYKCRCCCDSPSYRPIWFTKEISLWVYGAIMPI